MSTTRVLPERRNPHITPEETPAYDELLQLRRLGKTKLIVKPNQVGTSNATKVENLGPVEYAHLRAPLPDDLEDSEIFGDAANQETPSSYFLMRRSRDGYVSATGMFKVAFPWAAKADEKAERDYLYTLETTSQDDVAGNVWIAPEHSIELAAEYGLTTWVRALLDPTDIAQSSKKHVTEPPKFDLPIDASVQLLPPRDTKTPRSRSMRSMSPAKSMQPASSASKAKSPRKRQTKAQKEANIAAENAASATLQSTLDDVASNLGADDSDVQEAGTAESDSVEAEEVEIEIEEAEVEEEEEEAEPEAVGDKVTVEVDQAVEITNGTEVTHTNVTVSMPAGLPELPLPEDTEAMLEKAKQMVEEARALEASPKLSRKRKVEEVEPSDIDKELPVQPAKKARVLEEKLKRERVRNRAFVGVAAMLGVAAAIPYFF